jgi:hypothetical protein
MAVRTVDLKKMKLTFHVRISVFDYAVRFSKCLKRFGTTYVPICMSVTLYIRASMFDILYVPACMFHISYICACMFGALYMPTCMSGTLYIVCKYVRYITRIYMYVRHIIRTCTYVLYVVHNYMYVQAVITQHTWRLLKCRNVNYNLTKLHLIGIYRFISIYTYNSVAFSPEANYTDRATAEPGEVNACFCW